MKLIFTSKYYFLWLCRVVMGLIVVVMLVVDEVSGEVVLPGVSRLSEQKGVSEAMLGEVLMGELNCVACHGVEGKLKGRFERKRGPVLSDLKGRLHEYGVLEHIRDPRKARRGSLMPQVFDKRVEIDQKLPSNIVRWLYSFDSRFEKGEDVKGDSERGRKLYHEVGCVMCHQPLGKVEEGVISEERKKLWSDEIYVLNLKAIHRKYTGEGLEAYLLSPERYHPDGRMPNMKLSKQEAADLSSYFHHLTSRGLFADGSRVTPELIEMGKTAYFERGCVQCHGDPRDEGKRLPAPSAKPMLALDVGSEKSCVARERGKGKVGSYYDLNEKQRGWVVAALKGLKEVKVLGAQEVVARKLAVMNCTACHERDGVGRPSEEMVKYFKSSGEDLGDEGRMPPRLTGVGFKMMPGAIEKVLKGEGDIRPYMKTRMPVFSHGRVKGLGEAFEKADLPKGHEAVEVVGRNMYGRALVGVKGMGCIACHAFNGRRSLGINAVDITSSPGRLRPAWYRAYLKDPQKYRPGTRMPAFWPGGKKSAFKNVLGGDANKQIDAIWVYLMEADQTRLPEGLEKKGSYELKPAGEPVVLRLFMKEVGTHAVAVGYGEGVHGAFDGLNMNWVKFWKGRFIDAEGAWDDRFQAPAEPLGKDVLRLGDGAMFARLKGEGEVWPKKEELRVGYVSKGYVFDGDRMPEMRYAYGGMEVRDRLVPMKDGGGFNRSIAIAGEVEGVYGRLVVGKKIVKDGEVYVVDGKLRLMVKGVVGGLVKIKDVKGGQALVVGLRKDIKSIELGYSW